MLNEIKEFYRKNRLATYKNKSYRASITLYLYAAIGTFIASLVYLAMGVALLSVFIAVSGIVFVIGIFTYRKNHFKTTVVLSLIGVTIITVAGDVILGIACGAHYFLLGSVMLYVSTERKTVAFRYTCGAICLVEYVLITVFLTDAVPLVQMPLETVSVIDKVNLFIAFTSIGFTMHSYASAVEANETHIASQANSDLLTGLPNRRFTYKKLESLAAKTGSRGTEFVVALADIDDFKRLNDTYGHLCGDDVLVHAGMVMKKSLRKHDIIGRWGGEEFLIILPDTSLDDGLIIIDRLRNTLESSTFFIDRNEITVTITIGVSVFKGNSVITELIREADDRLYKGKTLGKNCVLGYD